MLFDEPHVYAQVTLDTVLVALIIILAEFQLRVGFLEVLLELNILLARVYHLNLVAISFRRRHLIA